MKTHKSNTLQLKKLTVARISPGTLNMFNGGSSYPPPFPVDDATVRRFNGACHQIY